MLGAGGARVGSILVLTVWTAYMFVDVYIGAWSAVETV
jgi:hypothetical protein